MIQTFIRSTSLRSAALLERLVLSVDWPSTAPQLFMLGLPRSGTTLIYQYIVHRLEVAYFTNGVGRYPCAPCLTTFLQRALHGTYQSSFKSHYGKVTGPVSPREAGGFWARFFGYEDYIRFEDLSAEDVRTLRRTIACVQHIFYDVPFVNKNVKHMLRIGALAKIFPDAYFLLVQRNLEDVALSVLRGRYTNPGNPRDWWSVKPSNFDTLKDLPIVEQVAKQVVALKERMKEDFSQIPASKILKIGYENFCESPETLIDEIKVRIGDPGDRNSATRSFKASHNQAESPEEQRLIEILRA